MSISEKQFYEAKNFLKAYSWALETIESAAKLDYKLQEQQFKINRLTDASKKGLIMFDGVNIKPIKEGFKADKVLSKISCKIINQIYEKRGKGWPEITKGI